MVLRTEGGELRVHPFGVKRATIRINLADLDDIVMDTKSVERVLDVSANIVNIGMGPLAPSITPPMETKRIRFESRSGSHSLTSEFYGHTETMEWFASIRRFLRSAGWTPLSERGESDDGDEAEPDTDDEDSAPKIRADIDTVAERDLDDEDRPPESDATRRLA